MAERGARRKSGNKPARRKAAGASRRFGMVGAAGFLALGAVLALAAANHGELAATAVSAYGTFVAAEPAPRKTEKHEPRVATGGPRRGEKTAAAPARRPVETGVLPSAKPPRPTMPVGNPAPVAAPADAALRTAALPVPRPRGDVTGTVEPKGMRLAGLRFPICGEVPSRNCVVDGDTFVVAGKAIRVADVATPAGGDPACAREAELASQAMRRLQQLLNAGPIELRTAGADTDVYGRKLRTVYRDGRSLGQTLIDEGLARRAGAAGNWCG